MQVDVLLKPNAEGYTATIGKPFDVSAHGRTEDETLARLKELVEEKLENGAKVVSFQVGPSEPTHIWKPFAGMFADSSLFDEWQEIIRERRAQEDAGAA